MHDVVMNVASKVLYLCLVGIDDFGLSSLKCRDELGNVEDLSIVEDAGLDFLHRGLAVRSISISSYWFYTNRVLTLRPRGL